MKNLLFIFMSLLWVFQCESDTNNCPLPETSRSQERLPENLNEFSDTEDIKTDIFLVRGPDPLICGNRSGGAGSNGSEDDVIIDSDLDPPGEQVPQVAPGQDEPGEISPPVFVSPDDPPDDLDNQETCLSQERKIRKENYQNFLNNVGERTGIDITNRAENINLSIGSIEILLKKSEVECIARHDFIQRLYIQKLADDPVLATRIIRVDEIEAPETVSASEESFTIILKNNCETDNSCQSEDYINCGDDFFWDANQQSNGLELTAKVSYIANATGGCDAVSIIFGSFIPASYEIQGPFQIGDFRIVVHQSDDTTLEKVVRIVE